MTPAIPATTDAGALADRISDYIERYRPDWAFATLTMDWSDAERVIAALRCADAILALLSLDTTKAPHVSP